MTKINNRYVLKPYRRELRSRMTKGEAILWNHIRNDVLGYRFRRQYSIGSYIVDFYCPKLKIAIEVDGFTHGEETIFAKDQIKQKFLEQQGIMVLRFNNQTIFNNLDNVVGDIARACEQRTDKHAPATPRSAAVAMERRRPTPSW